MEYEELVRKIQDKEKVTFREITGVQLLMLLRDGIIKSINYFGTLYEMNFIPITYAYEPIEINDSNCATIGQAETIITKILKSVMHEKVYLHLGDKYYHIIIEILESNNE